jgi:hypothetical protein
MSSSSSTWQFHTTDGLSDVKITNPRVDGHVLVMRNGVFRNESAPVTGATDLNGLSDVTVTTPADGQQLVYDSGTGKWVNVDQPNDNRALVNGVGNDVVYPNATEMRVEVRTGVGLTVDVNNDLVLDADLNDLKDVEITLPLEGNVLQYDTLSAKWKNATAPSQIIDLPTVLSNGSTATDVIQLNAVDPVENLLLGGNLIVMTGAGVNNQVVINMISGESTWPHNISQATPPSLNEHLTNKLYVDTALDNQQLGDHTDVTIATPANGQVLTYNTGTSKWENAALPVVGTPDLDAVLTVGNDAGNQAITGLANGILPQDAATISNLTSALNNQELGDHADVTIVTPANGEVLTYNTGTSKWENQTLPATPDLDAVLTVGNDAGAKKIINLLDGTDPQDAATISNLTSALNNQELGDVVTYNTGTSKWENQTLPATPDLDAVLTVGNDAGAKKIINLLDGTDPQDAATINNISAQTLDNHVDVTLTAPTNGQVLTYNTGTSKWENQTLPAPSLALDDLTDVVTAGQTTGSFLRYDGALWQPALQSSAITGTYANMFSLTPVNGDRYFSTDLLGNWVYINGAWRSSLLLSRIAPNPATYNYAWMITNANLDHLRSRYWYWWRAEDKNASPYTPAQATTFASRYSGPNYNTGSSGTPTAVYPVNAIVSGTGAARAAVLTANANNYNHIQFDLVNELGQENYAGSVLSPQAAWSGWTIAFVLSDVVRFDNFGRVVTIGSTPKSSNLIDWTRADALTINFFASTTDVTYSNNSSNISLTSSAEIGAGKKSIWLIQYSQIDRTLSIRVSNGDPLERSTPALVNATFRLEDGVTADTLRYIRFGGNGSTTGVAERCSMNIHEIVVTNWCSEATTEIMVALANRHF